MVSSVERHSSDDGTSKKYAHDGAAIVADGVAYHSVRVEMIGDHVREIVGIVPHIAIWEIA